jgi:uncharacterized protein (DUF1330 family)
MTVYVIAQLKFTDRASYDRYQSAFPEVFRRFNGTLLAADEKPQVLEGDWTRDKVVLISFPDAPSREAWANSPEYEEIAKYRRAGADAIVLTVRGLDAR